MRTARNYLVWCVGLALLVLLGGNAVQAQVMSPDQIEKVRSELVKLPYYGVFDYLEFSVNGRTVTLKGYATRPTLKSDAEAVVRVQNGDPDAFEDLITRQEQAGSIRSAAGNLAANQSSIRETRVACES